MEKGRTSGAAHKSSKGKSSSSKGEQQQRALSPEQYLVIKRQEAVEKVMAAFNRRLADELAIITHAHEAAGGGEGASGSGSGGSHSGGDLNSGGGNAGRPSGRGKRQFDDGDRNDSSSGGNGGNGQDKGGNKRAKTEENPGKSFVCPFFRHDPKRFCHHRICAGPGVSCSTDLFSLSLSQACANPYSAVEDNPSLEVSFVGNGFGLKCMLIHGLENTFTVSTGCPRMPVPAVAIPSPTPKH